MNGLLREAQIGVHSGSQGDDVIKKSTHSNPILAGEALSHPS
jgi:hypothetical protein